MKKFNDIFSIDSSTGGGKRLIKKIINKYRLGNEYKEIKENIENKGGSSNDAVYYKAIKEFSTGNTLFNMIMSFTQLLNINEYSHDFDYGSYILRYDMALSDKVKNTKRIFGIVTRPGKINMSGQELAINSLEELFSVPEFSQSGNIVEEFYNTFELSTKEEIEKVMDELINQ